MITYLYHKLHGVHIAYSQEEVNRLMKTGWLIKEDKPKRETLHLKKDKRK